MELNLAVRSRNCSDGHALVEGVHLRDTRSSYFLNLSLQGLKKEDIQLEMDNERSFIIRGQKYSQDMGMLSWTWRLVDNGGPISSTRRRPFRIPQDVNVGAIRATFHQGVLHIAMPKFKQNRFIPYNNHIHSSRNRPRQQKQHQPQTEETTNKMAAISDTEKVQHQNVDMEMEMLFPTHPEDGMSMVITVEEQCRKVPGEGCPSSDRELQISLEEDLMKGLGVSHESENPQEKQEDAEEESVAREEIQAHSPSHRTTQAKQGTSSSSEEKERNCENRKREKMIVNNYTEREMVEIPKPFLCKGLSHIFSSIAGIGRRKLSCR